jgi:hypothetical protein
LNAKLRTRSASARAETLVVVRHKNADLADLAKTAAAEAERLLTNAKRALHTARKKAAELAAPRLEPAIKRLKKLTGRTPLTVTADRCYGEQAVDDALHDLGIGHVVIPRRGRPGKAGQAHERSPPSTATRWWPATSVRSARV